MSSTISQLEPASIDTLTESRQLPHELKDFRNYHAGETILVCGCGYSLGQVVAPEKFITVGVNDVGRLFQPDYLVVLNPRQQFKGDRFKFVEQSRAQAIFTQLELGIRHPHIVKIRLGKYGGVDFFDPASLHFTRNSPYLALCLAIHMGAKRIGLIGVDFTQDHFFARTGPHPLTRELAQINREYEKLYAACKTNGIKIFNLSANSCLTAFPRLSMHEFSFAKKSSLRIVSYSITPMAGVPAILSRCIAACTPHQPRCVVATNSYGNGVSFDGDVEWNRSPEKARELLRSSDLVIVHNGKVDPSHRALFIGKPVITMAHNYLWNVDTTFQKAGCPAVVVGQYQATLAEFKGWHPIPNPIPLWEQPFQPADKSVPLTICYTPSGKHESYPSNHRLYWHSKGYNSTTKALHNLARRFQLRLELIGPQQITHAMSLAMKRRSHIVIDECVTGSYHRNSLEGLACGAVVVNGIGLLPDINKVFQYCADDATEIPFVCASLDALESVLASLIENGHDALVAQGACNRAWMEKHWNFARQWERYWEPVVIQALDRPRHNNNYISSLTKVQTEVSKDSIMRPATTKTEWKSGLSVVVCHGGRERLSHLSASLANICQSRDVNEIIVVDMGKFPEAEEVARRWADKYIFLHNEDVFERARCLNVGSGLAEFDLVLWKDNDLIVPPNFVSSAVAEMRKRQLDYLIPYVNIHYLSLPESQRVMEGTQNPADCAPVKAYRALRQVCGAAGVVRKSFLHDYGGMSEAFRGWGGEDDAWLHKARLLGRIGVTQNQTQCLYHLFHLNSGANGGSEHRENNPYYSKNVVALHEMRSIKDRGIFLKRFPSQPLFSNAWADKKVVLLRASGDSATPDKIAQELTARIKIKAEIQISTDHSSARDKLLAEKPDAIVIFGLNNAISFLSDAKLKDLWPKIIVLCAGDEVIDQSVSQLNKAGALVCPKTFSEIRARGLWFWTFAADAPNPSCAIAITLLQPLSIVLGGAKSQTVTPAPQRKSRRANQPEKEVRLPVWMYWEGARPEWIQQCQQTVFAHAEDVRLLSSDDFERLRDTDRDIRLSHLHVAQRADYIRAFLLARYGGLWIDCDCIVMQDLQPAINLLRHYDFVAHKERTAGLMANDFMAAAPGSKIASALYQRIGATLRSGKHVGWTALGCVAVTESLRNAGVPWLEIESERIQPICWSNPAPYFEVKSSDEHDQRFDSRALCYMLSNLTMQKLQNVSDLSQQLCARDTFFSYLIDKSTKKSAKQAMAAKRIRRKLPDVEHSLGISHPMVEAFTQMLTACSKAGMESLSGPGSSLMHTAELRQQLPVMMQEIGARSLLDAPCGDFNWMKHVVLGIDQYTGVDVIPSLIAQNQKNFGGPKRSFMVRDVAHQELPAADVVMCRDCLVHFSNADIFRALRNFKNSGSKYLLTTTFTQVQANSDIATGDWRPLNLQRTPFNLPPPMRILNEKCTEGGGKYRDKSLALWKLDDIQGSENEMPSVALRQETVDPHPMVEAFTQMLTACSKAGMESLSGPGSSLMHTAELRQQLPVMMQEIGARSLLDAPCGDFNWMKHVVLGIDQYTGVDVIPSLIAQNQKNFGGPKRSFMVRDVAHQELPAADVVMCRDCLVHFSNADIFRALRNFKNSGSKYLLTTTFTQVQANSDIATGDWRPLNLQRTPFNLPPPMRILNEKCTEGGGKYRDKSLALWKLDDIP